MRKANKHPGKAKSKIVDGPTILMVEAVHRSPQAVSRLPQDSDLVLKPLMTLEVAQERLSDLQKFVKMYLHEEEDYGKVPGTPKPTLYKPGADKLCDIYGLADTYVVTNRTEDWEKNLFDYEMECRLISKRTRQLVASGFGSCNSYESKYRYREESRKCPSCGKSTIIKGREEYGGGWLCFGKKGGCGAKYGDGEAVIEQQPCGRVLNDDVPTLKNTILKMAKKRAKVDAVLAATRSSGIFTQDLEALSPTGENIPGKRWTGVSSEADDNANAISEASQPGSADAAQAVANEKIAALRQKLGNGLKTGGELEKQLKAPIKATQSNRAGRERRAEGHCAPECAEPVNKPAPDPNRVLFVTHDFPKNLFAVSGLPELMKETGWQNFTGLTGDEVADFSYLCERKGITLKKLKPVS